MASNSSQVNQAARKPAESPESISGTSTNAEPAAQINMDTQPANPPASSANLPFCKPSTSKSVDDEYESVVEGCQGLSCSKRNPKPSAPSPSTSKQLCAQIPTKANLDKIANASKIPLHNKDDALGVVLARFSLQERLQLRIICRRWRTIIEQSFTSPDFKSLKLFNSNEALTGFLHYVKQLLPFDRSLQLNNDDLVFNSKLLSAHMADTQEHAKRNRVVSQLLSGLYPNITELVIAFDWKYYNDKQALRPFRKFDVSSLLARWPHLTSLTIWHLPSNWNSLGLEHEEHAICDTISEMSSLTCLQFLKVQRLPLISRHAYRRLHKFTLINYDPYYHIDWILPHLQKCNELKFRDLNCINTRNIINNFRMNDLLIENLRRLTFNLPFGDGILFLFTCRAFKSLEFLEVFFDPCKKLDLFRTAIELSRLTKLRELRLSIIEPSNLENVAQLPTLFSIKVLYLVVKSLPDTPSLPRPSFYLFLQHMLPCLEEIRFASNDERILMDARRCFTKVNFALLKRKLFVSRSQDMFPSAYPYMGQHVDLYKSVEHRLDKTPIAFSSVS